MSSWVPQDPTASQLVELTGLRYDAALRVVAKVADERETALAAGERACRRCGCTNNSACFGGCAWVESDLCSRCA